MYVCTTYHVLRIFLLLAQTCVQLCCAIQNIVTCYCYLLRQCKLFTEAVEVCTCTQRLPSTYGYELHIVYNSRSAPMLKWSEGYPQDGILSVGNSERFGIDKHFIT